MYSNKYVVFNNQTKQCQFLKSNEIVEHDGVLTSHTSDYGHIIEKLSLSDFNWVKNHCKKSIVEFKRKCLEALTIDVKADVLGTDKSVFKRLLQSYNMTIVL